MKAIDIIDKVKLPLKYKIILTLGTGILVYTPRDWTQKYFNIEITGLLRTSLEIIFIIFLSFSVIEILINLITIITIHLKDEIKIRKNRNKIIKNLYELTEKEKDYLYTFLRDNTITQNMPTNDGITQSLVAKRMIFRSSNIGTGLLNFPYNINNIVWNEIQKNPEIFKNKE